MKRVKPVFWIALTLACLPPLILAGMVQTARHKAEARRHQHQLNRDLFHAVQANALPQVEALLAQGAETSAREDYEEPDTQGIGWWQQWLRQWHGDTSSDANADSEQTAYRVALDNAAQTNFKDWRVLKALVDHGATVNAHAFQGMDQTALDWTTELKNWEATVYLLDHGANPGITGMSNSNPFLQTVACDNLPVVTKMLDKGANVNFVPDSYGDTALCIAVIHENPAMIRLLLQRGADINLPNHQGQTPLHRCQGSEKEVEIATLLLENGADPNRQDNDGDTPLMAAAQNGDASMTRLYLAHKASAVIRNSKGQTALQLAQSRKHADIAVLMKQAGVTR